MPYSTLCTAQRTVSVVYPSCRSSIDIAESEDGLVAASSHGDHLVRLTDTRTGASIALLSGHPRTVWSLDFHLTQDSYPLLATACLGGRIRIWTVPRSPRPEHFPELALGQRNPAYTLNQSWGVIENGTSSGIAWHPTLPLLAYPKDMAVWFAWVSREGIACSTAIITYREVKGLAFSHDGHSLLVASQRPDDSNKGICHLRAFKLAVTRQFSRNRRSDGTALHRITFQPSTPHAPVIVNSDMSADDDVGVIRATCPVERVLWTDERARCRFVDIPRALQAAAVESGRFPEAPQLGNGEYVVLDQTGRPRERQQEQPVDEEPRSTSQWALVAHSPATVATGAVVLSRRGIALTRDGLAVTLASAVNESRVAVQDAMVELAAAVRAYSTLAIQLGALSDLLAALERDDAGEGRPLCATMGCSPSFVRDRAHARLRGLAEGPECVATGVDTICRGWRLLSAELELVKRETASWAGPLTAPGPAAAATRAANVLGAVGLFNLARRAARRASRVTVNCANATHHVEVALQSTLAALRPHKPAAPEWPHRGRSLSHGHQAPSGAGTPLPGAGTPTPGDSVGSVGRGFPTSADANTGPAAPAECGHKLAAALLRDFDRACDPLVGILDLARRVMLELEELEGVVDQSLPVPQSTTAYAAGVHAPSGRATAGPSAPNPTPATYNSADVPTVTWRAPRARLPPNALAAWFAKQNRRLDRLRATERHAAALPAVFALGDHHDFTASTLGPLFPEEGEEGAPSTVEQAAPAWDPRPHRVFAHCPWTRRQRLRSILADAFGCPHAAVRRGAGAVCVAPGRDDAPQASADVPVYRPHRYPRRSLNEHHTDARDVIMPLCELDIAAFCSNQAWAAAAAGRAGSDGAETWARLKADALRTAAEGAEKGGAGNGAGPEKATDAAQHTAVHRYARSVLRRADGRRVERWAAGPNAWRRRPAQRVYDSGRAELARWEAAAPGSGGAQSHVESGAARGSANGDAAAPSEAPSSIAGILTAEDEEEDEEEGEDLRTAVLGRLRRRSGNGGAAVPSRAVGGGSGPPPVVRTTRAAGRGGVGQLSLRSPPTSRAGRNGSGGTPTAPSSRPTLRRVGTHSPMSRPNRRAPRRPVARGAGVELLRSSSSEEEEEEEEEEEGLAGSGPGGEAATGRAATGEAVDPKVWRRARAVRALLSACGCSEKDHFPRATVYNGIVDYLVRAVQQRALQFRVRTRRVLGKVGGDTPLPLIRPTSCIFALCRLAIPTVQHAAYSPHAQRNAYSAAGISVGRDVVNDKYGALQRGGVAAEEEEEEGDALEEEEDDPQRQGGKQQWPQGAIDMTHASAAPKRASPMRVERQPPAEVLPGKRRRLSGSRSREQVSARSPVGGAWPGDRLHLVRAMRRNESAWPRARNQEHAHGSIFAATSPHAAQRIQTPPQAIPALPGPLLRSMRLLPAQLPPPREVPPVSCVALSTTGAHTVICVQTLNPRSPGWSFVVRGQQFESATIKAFTLDHDVNALVFPRRGGIIEASTTGELLFTPVV